MNTIYRLEYSDKQRCFHFAHIEEGPKRGWVALRILPSDECKTFVFFMYKKYVDGRKTGTLPELKVVDLELQLFAELKDTRRKLAGRV